jgi:S1-C subfamily serine protease
MKKYNLGICGLILPLIVIALFLRGATGNEDANGTVETARKVMEKHKDAIAQVVLVVKAMIVIDGRQMSGGEKKIKTNGTVVDPSGITVISYSLTNPSASRGIDLGEDKPNINLETLVTSAKIVFADGSEYPAEVVLRDRELDLAFIRPKKTGLNLPYLKLKTAPQPDVLDEIIALTRLDRFANREPSVHIDRISSIIRKPRVRYVAVTSLESGCPVFNASGELLGLVLMRPGDVKKSGAFSFLDKLASVLPCKDIAKVMKQIPAVEDKK